MVWFPGAVNVASNSPVGPEFCGALLVNQVAGALRLPVKRKFSSVFGEDCMRTFMLVCDPLKVGRPGESTATQGARPLPFAAMVLIPEVASEPTVMLPLKFVAAFGVKLTLTLVAEPAAMLPLFQLPLKPVG